jgi:hypothetical protein
MSLSIPKYAATLDIKLEFRGMISDYSVGGGGEQEPIFGGSGGNDNNDDGSGSGQFGTDPGDRG